jgi:hypothetical protein
MIYKTGDLFADIESLIKGPTVLLLPHVCNNVHKWGSEKLTRGGSPTLMFT